MKIAKPLVTLMMIALLAGSMTAQEAQKKKGQKKVAAKLNPVFQAALRMERLQDALKKVDLTEEQQGELKELQTSMRPKMEGVFKKVIEMLGEEKMKQISELVAKGKEEGKSSRQIAVNVEKELKLTADQQEKMAKVGKELSSISREAMKTVNKMLTDEQKTKLKAAMGPQKKRAKKKDK